jgi:DNA/RNA endonuclease YhcR with UshA esterase domain
MENLVVKDVYTTDNEESSSNGAMTLTCEVNGVTVSVRTVVLIDGNGNLVTADAYMGKTIDVRGIVDYFDGTYQIKVFSVNDITIHN